MDGEQKIDHFFDDEVSRSREVHPRHSLAFVASIAAHALILLGLVFLVPEMERPHHDWVLAYLVEFDQSGGAGRGAGAGMAGASSSPASARGGTTAAMPPKPHHGHRHAAPHTEASPPRAARQMAAIPASPVPGDGVIAARSARASSAASAPDARAGVEVASATSGGSASGLGGGNGAGSGGGEGSGSGFAHVAYGQNPGPSYPIEARRRAEQGTVLLRIEVGADGSVERVEVAQSSGFNSLDESAVETVRTRWRFVAARRDGLAVESWCMVPIRFALTEARAN